MDVTINSQIRQVLNKNSILEFLSKRGHTPVRSMGNGRYNFLCPFEDHKETKPSFVVYTNADFENFYCFGCSRGYNIIHLIANLDKISFRSALEKLSDGTIISTDEDIKILLDKIKVEPTTEDNFTKTLIQISSQCLLFSQGVEYDETEMKIIDAYYKFVDDNILSVQLDKIEESSKYLQVNLMRRKVEYEKRKLENARKVL